MQKTSRHCDSEQVVVSLYPIIITKPLWTIPGLGSAIRGPGAPPSPPLPNLALYITMTKSKICPHAVRDMLILADLIPGVGQITPIRDPLLRAQPRCRCHPLGATRLHTPLPIKPVVDVAMFQVSRPQKLVSLAVEDIDYGVLKKGGGGGAVSLESHVDGATPEGGKKGYHEPP